MSAPVRGLSLFLVVLLCWPGAARLLGQTAASPTVVFSPQPWLDDFHQLLAEMDSHYADLDWAIHDRHMDLPALRKATEEKLTAAGDEANARKILQQFLNAFGDGHLSVRWPSQTKSATVVEETNASAPLCSRLGYQDSTKSGIDFTTLPEFSVLSGDGAEWFPGGLLPMRGEKIGVLRIARFDEHGFPSACERALREMKLNQDSACDDDCEREVSLRASNLLTAVLIRRAEELRSRGATALMIDVTRNDGGDDWNEAVVRALSRIPLQEQQQGFLKHPMWTARLERQLQEVESDLENGAQPIQVLEQAASSLRKNIALSKQPCDRSRAFTDGVVPCSLVVKTDFYWSGILPYAKPGSLAGLQSRTTLFNPLQYEYTENSRRLPLLVAVDTHSWSSAERFAALLQDNGAAKIVGELSGGAGCGLVDGGIPTTLARTDARVTMPNCVGFRKDGSNANDGVTPDVFVPWATRDTPYTRARKTEAALERSLKTANRRLQRVR